MIHIGSALRFGSAFADGSAPTKAEMGVAGEWCDTAFSGAGGSLPFSFVYDGKPFDGMKGWNLKTASQQLSGKRQERTLTFTDPKTGLEVKCVAVNFRDFPAVEWTLYLRNTGATSTPIISDIRAVDLKLDRASAPEFVLNHNNGDVHKSGMNFEPLRTVLEPGKTFQLQAKDGLPTQESMPYFNIEHDCGGLITVIGWPGQWACQFMRDGGAGLRVLGGQQYTHFRLHPGEEMRCPRIVLMWWDGAILRSQNMWRRWMLAHNTPRPGGKPLRPFLAGNNSVLLDYTGMTEQNQKEFIDRYIEEQIPIDAWWVDAGWYPVPEGAPWYTYGTWKPDPKRFPNGLGPVMDYAHSKGLKTVLWFCPDHVSPGTYLYINRKNWLLGDCLFDYGNPEAWQWLLNLADSYITDLKLDVYRTDNDINPLPLWQKADAEDRQGITEIRFVTGFLALYDELRKRHPNLLIDNCCAGGRRNDVETLRRSVPLWRSDLWTNPNEMQCQTFGLAAWIPYYGHASGQLDPYVFRSNMHPSGLIFEDIRNRDRAFDPWRRLIGQLREVAPDFLGDFYPLTPYSQASDTWLAWQYDRPEAGEGVIQAFRRSDCSRESRTLMLHGLDPSAQFNVTDLDSKMTALRTGAELMNNGITVTIPAKPGAALLIYKRVVCSTNR